MSKQAPLPITLNPSQLQEVRKRVTKMGAGELSAFIKELKLRASGLNTHYGGPVNMRYINDEEIPDVGLLGKPDGFAVSKDIKKRYEFQTEYYSLSQQFAFFGYSRMKEIESIDPSAMSQIMSLVFEKRKIFEDRVMQLMGSINQVVQSVLRILYELKELDRNVIFYEQLKSKDPKTIENAEMSIKRIFVDTVDSRKGGASMLSLVRAASQSGGGGPGFTTLVAAFYSPSIKSAKDVDKLSLNEQVKNILKPRVEEYIQWKSINETDLRNRKSMLLQYLTSQVGSYKMYVQWASQYLNILKRINQAPPQSAGKYMSSLKTPDIFNTAVFSLNMMGFKEIFMGEYDIEWSRPFGSKGIQLPESASLKTNSGDLMTRGGRETQRRFIYDKVKKYGPIVMSAIEAEFSFREKPILSEDVPQQPLQYEGTLDLKLTPYCFTLEEWYLFKAALEEQIRKTVFADMDQVLTSSLESMKSDLDKYLEEASKLKLKEDKQKKPNEFALMDIFQSFKEDFLGVTKYIPTNFKSESPENPEFYTLYTMIVNKRQSFLKMKDALKLGLFTSISDSSLIYEEFKRRVKLLNPLSKFDIF